MFKQGILRHLPYSTFFSISFSLSLSLYFLSHSISLLHSIFSPFFYCLSLLSLSRATLVHSSFLYFFFLPLFFPSSTLLSFLLSFFHSSFLLLLFVTFFFPS